MTRPVFVSFEGADGAGKSTQVRMLAEALGTRNVIAVREPGGTPLGEQIRGVLLYSDSHRTPEAEMHLFLAARAELVAEVITPALSRGSIVIADRYHDSTLAYQGGGRGLTPPAWPASFPRPDVTFLLALPPDEGLLRASANGRPDRLEAEGIDFQRAVGEAYERLAAAEPERWVRIDASRPPEEVHSTVMDRIATLLQPAVR